MELELTETGDSHHWWIGCRKERHGSGRPLPQRVRCVCPERTADSTNNCHVVMRDHEAILLELGHVLENRAWQTSPSTQENIVLRLLHKVGKVMPYPFRLLAWKMGDETLRDCIGSPSSIDRVRTQLTSHMRRKVHIVCLKDLSLLFRLIWRQMGGSWYLPKSIWKKNIPSSDLDWGTPCRGDW